jgi:peptide/nickel transport system substrate-binding protein
MKYNSAAIANICLLVGIFIFVCCGNTDMPALVEEPKFEGVLDISYSGYTAGKPGGKIRRAFVGEGPKTFNAVVGNDESSADVIGLMYAALVRRNQMSLEWEPWLASGWTVAEDGTSITFTLREGLKWSDGFPITAEDFEYTHSLIMTRGLQGNASLRFFINDTRVTVEALDELNVRFNFTRTNAVFFETASFYPLPKHIVEPVFSEIGVKAFNKFWSNETDISALVGCGPFLPKEYIPGQQLTMIKNPGYFEVDELGVKLPYIDEYVIFYVKDEEKALEKFLFGEIDFYEPIPSDYRALLTEKETLNFVIGNAGPETDSLILAFNQNPIDEDGDAGIPEPQLTWLSNKKFRYAISLLIDRSALIDKIAGGLGYPQYSFIPALSPYYQKGAEPQGSAYDPDKAQLVLDEIGYVDADNDGWREDQEGRRIVLSLFTNNDNEDRIAIGEMLSQEAKRIGIDLQVIAEDFNIIVTRLVSTCNWHMILIGLSGFLDPLDAANVFPSYGFLHIIEPAQSRPRREWEKMVDLAWQKAEFTLDENERLYNYAEIQRIWTDELPWIYLFNNASLNAYNRNLRNIFPRSIQGFGLEAVASRIFIEE